MRIQKINQNNYRTEQKQSFKENVLARITHFPKYLSKAQLEGIMNDTTYKLYEKIISQGYMEPNNFGVIIHNRSFTDGYELCCVDESTQMAEIAEQLDSRQITPKAFYDSFLSDPELKQVSIRAIYDRSELRDLEEIAMPIPTKPSSPQGMSLKTTPQIKF